MEWHQPMTVPALVLGPRAGRLNPEAIERIDHALRFVFGLWRARIRVVIGAQQTSDRVQP